MALAVVHPLPSATFTPATRPLWRRFLDALIESRRLSAERQLRRFRLENRQGNLCGDARKSIP